MITKRFKGDSVLPPISNLGHSSGEFGLTIVERRDKSSSSSDDVRVREHGS